MQFHVAVCESYGELAVEKTGDLQPHELLFGGGGLLCFGEEVEGFFVEEVALAAGDQNGKRDACLLLFVETGNVGGGLEGDCGGGEKGEVFS